MKDDEGRILFASQKAGKFVRLEGIAEERLEEIRESWIKRLWISRQHERLSFDAIVAEGAVGPDEPEVDAMEPIPEQVDAVEPPADPLPASVSEPEPEPPPSPMPQRSLRSRRRRDEKEATADK